MLSKGRRSAWPCDGLSARWSRQDDLAEGLGYTLKRRLLGRPLINEQLGEQRLSKRLALGVLSPDGISSSAYGTEEILIELLKGGLAVTAFTLILPLTGVVLFVMILVVLSYREVVTVYTRAGGSYVVATGQLRPAGSPDRGGRAAHRLRGHRRRPGRGRDGRRRLRLPELTDQQPDVITVISIGVVLLMLYGNLRGIREAGKAFAVPTYLFSGVVIIMIIVGLGREIFGSLPRVHIPTLAPAVYGAHVLAYHEQPDHVRDDLRAPARLRQRRLLADRHRGRLQRGQRVQAAGGASTPARSW